MAEIQYSFQRYEKKFLLTPGQAEGLLPLLERRLAADRYRDYTICSLYYDTEDFQLIRESIRKPPYKEKFRLRSYGVPGEEDLVFGELKKKFDGVVYKRRVAAPCREMLPFLAGGALPGEDPQIQREIHWFLRVHPIRPRVFIGYERTAFAGREDPALRVTLDRNIRWRDRELDLRAGDHGAPVLPEERVVMEVKADLAVPLWLARVLSEAEARPGGFSKYGACYQRHLALRAFAPRPPRSTPVPRADTARKTDFTERMILPC